MLTVIDTDLAELGAWGWAGVGRGSDASPYGQEPSCRSPISGHGVCVTRHAARASCCSAALARGETHAVVRIQPAPPPHLVLDDGDAPAVAGSKDVVEEGSLAAAEEAREHGDRNALVAFLGGLVPRDEVRRVHGRSTVLDLRSQGGSGGVVVAVLQWIKHRAPVPGR